MRLLALRGLGGNYVTLVDDADFDRLSTTNWSVRKGNGGKLYAGRFRHVTDGPGTEVILMHHVILGVPPSNEIDHVNGNGLDNRRINLRRATRSQNLANIRVVRGVSRYKGVSWKTDRGKWRAQIRSGRNHLHLGYFVDEETAAAAYDAAALELHGSYAATNIMIRRPLP